MKKLSQQAKSRIFTETNNYASSSMAEVEFFLTAYMLWFYFILGSIFYPSFWFMLMYDNKFKTKEIQFKPRTELNHAPPLSLHHTPLRMITDLFRSSNVLVI